MGAIYIGKKLGPGGFEKEVVLKQLLPEYTVAARVPRPVLSRGQDLGDARPRQHRPHVRPRRVRRVVVHRHGVRARRRPADDRPARPPAAPRARARRRDPRRARRARGPRLRARAQGRERRVARHHPPRRLALEHPVLRAGRGEAVGLRHRQGLDALVGLLSRARQGRLHVARAGAQRARRSPLRSLLARRVPVRGAHGRAAVRGRSLDAARRHLRPAHPAAVEEAARICPRRSTTSSRRRSRPSPTTATRTRRRSPRRCGRRRIASASCTRRRSSPTTCATSSAPTRRAGSTRRRRARDRVAEGHGKDAEDPRSP